MDPISAFGLAVNILTVIDLSAKVISTASEIRSYGESITTSDRVAVAQHFESRCEKLIRSSKTMAKTSGGSSDAAILTEDDASLHQLAEEAKDIARDIQQLLVRRQKGQALFKTLRDAVLCVWGERGIKEKTERLKEMRAEIQFGLMVSIKASVGAASLREDQTSQKLDNATQQVISVLLSENDAIRSDMERRVEELNQEVVRHFDRASRLASQHHDELLSAIAWRSGLAMSAILEDPAIVTERILKRLWFPRINDRYEDIFPAHKKTFEWIFSRDLRFKSSSNFIEWVENGTGIYWMSGRAGSGKSTLVKYMADHSQTEMLFRTWAGGQPLVTAKYLFWDLSPDILQKSLDGLFRGILYEIVRKETSFAPLLFPDQFEEENGWSGSFPTSNELKRAFKRLISLDSSPTQVALFIDGLDEYSASRGAQHDLAETLKRAAYSKHMKIIASSRPETVFEKAFSDCNKLYLHDMTSQDQTLFVSDKLYEHQRTSYLVNISGGKKSIDFLITSAVERSEGVFLWLRLVVEALVKELDVCESIKDLHDILLQFPRGLEHLFLHMMRRMLRENERRGFECLWVMRQSLSLQYKRSPYHDGGLNGRRAADDNYSFKLTAFCMDGAQMPLDTVLNTEVTTLGSVALKDTVTKVENRLRNWCAGLLELKPISGFTGLEEPEVAFIHRSVSQFLNLPTACSDLVEELAETSFDVNFMLMKGLLIKLKREAPTWHFHPTGRIWVFVELIIRLAQFANDDRRHETHALLSELDRSMTSLFEIRRSNPAFWEMCKFHSGTNHWTSSFPWDLRLGRKDFRTPCICIQRIPYFLSIAVENGLAEFVLDTLKNPEIKRAVKATMGASLLNSACRPPPFSIAIPGTIRPAIIHRLLDLGADPNQVCQDGAGKQTTPWKSMLNTVTDLEIMTVEGARQFSEILKAMIKHGADQRVRIPTKIITQGDDTDSRSSTEVTYSPDNFTASKTTDQNDWEWIEVRRPNFALSEVQTKDLTDLKKGCLTVRGIIHQAFVTKPSFRKISHGADLPGSFVPFEEIDSTWEIRDEVREWGRRYGATYPDNCHPPKLTSSEKKHIQEMGFALMKLLDQKKSPQNDGSGAVQSASTEQPRISKLGTLHTMKTELLSRFRRNRK